MVPLWFDELVYDSPVGEILVNCIPILPDGYILTENSDLHFPLELKVHDIWGKESIDAMLGDMAVKVPVNHLLCSPTEQYVEINEKGIGVPIMNDENIYNIQNRGKIIAIISLIL